jgi:hypothetical protein
MFDELLKQVSVLVNETANVQLFSSHNGKITPANVEFIKNGGENIFILYDINEIEAPKAWREFVGFRYIATFRMSQLNGCCGVCVSYNVQTSEAYRGRGIGKLLNQLRVQIADYLDYTVLLCTDVQQNTAQRKIIAKNSWKDIHTFVNKRTNNTVNISVINL